MLRSKAPEEHAEITAHLREAPPDRDASLYNKEYAKHTNPHQPAVALSLLEHRQERLLCRTQLRTVDTACA